MGRSMDFTSLTVAPTSLPGHHSAPTYLPHLNATSHRHNLNLVIICNMFCVPTLTSLSPRFFPFCPPFPPIYPSSHPYSVELLFICHLHLSHLALLLSLESPLLLSPLHQAVPYSRRSRLTISMRTGIFLKYLFCSLP